jgi:hypothetical protein
MGLVLVCIAFLKCQSGKKILILDDDECARGSLICPTNSFCRNTPGSYAVSLFQFWIKRKDEVLFFSAIVLRDTKC